MNEEQIEKDYGRAVDRYNRLLTRRMNHEGAWRDCAKLTLPYVFPPSDNHSGSEFFPTPYNSTGAKAVNTLAAKLLLALLPPTGNFFRLLPHKEQMDKLSTEEKRDVDKQLSQLERDITERITVQAIRVPLFEAIKQLIVVGNSLLYKIPGGSFKVFAPYEYVVQRNYAGDLMEICLKERISKRVLPEDVQAIIDHSGASSTSNNQSKPEDEVDIYTVVVKTGKNSWFSWQEAADEPLPSTITNYTDETMPYLALRWTSVPNEEYGRGQVEQVLGDLRSLEAVSQLLVEGASVSAKTIFGLKPSAITQMDDLDRAANGDFILGDLEKDISVLRVDKTADFQIPFKYKQELEASISQAFLSFASSVRDSERTTAVEVRATQAELEAALGGTYSVLAQDFQLPLLRMELHEINSKVLKLVTPSIVTGVSAISRERDLQNLNYMAQTLAQFGDAGLQYFNMSGYLTSLATSLGIDPELIVKSQDQMEQEMAQQNQQAAAQMQAKQQIQQQQQGG